MDLRHSTDRLLRMLARPSVLVSVLALITVVVSVQSVLIGPRTFVEGGPLYTDYNNYVIFRQAGTHLLAHQPLYVLYPAEHWDLYKYTPTFALAFIPFAQLPDLVGLPLWNLLNTLALVLALLAVPQLSRTQQALAILLLLIELITSLQNSQSNGLIAGCIIGAFAALERDKQPLAALLLVVAAFIKPFVLAAGPLMLLYPRGWRAVSWGVAWGIVLLLAPLVVVTPQELLDSYADWLVLLGNDHGANHGYSVMGWLATWFHWRPAGTWILGVGLVLLLAAFVRTRMLATAQQRSLLLAFVLIWMVIFNHMAESPTFIIAMAGVALWFVHPGRGKLDVTLFVLTFLFTCLSPTDVFPSTVRETWVKPYVLKAVPCIAIAALLWFRLVFGHRTVQPTSGVDVG